MIEQILKRFQDGEYEGENGAKLFILDMQEVQDKLTDLEEKEAQLSTLPL